MSLDLTLRAAAYGHWTMVGQRAIQSLCQGFDVILRNGWFEISGIAYEGPTTSVNNTKFVYDCQSGEWQLFFPDGKIIVCKEETTVNIPPEQNMSDLQKRCLGNLN